MKTLVKKLARIKASSICRQQFANVFAGCFYAVHTHQLEFANTRLPTLACEGRFKYDRKAFLSVTSVYVWAKKLIDAWGSSEFELPFDLEYLVTCGASIRPKLIPEIPGERMKQTFSGISFRKFGCTSQGWPKILENRNNRKIPFHSTIPARA